MTIESAAFRTGCPIMDEPLFGEDLSSENHVHVHRLCQHATSVHLVLSLFLCSFGLNRPLNPNSVIGSQIAEFSLSDPFCRLTFS
jgi:hypothetical protein